MIHFPARRLRHARIAVPLTALSVAAASVILATPAHAGTVQPHIIGGTPTSISSAPWMVQLWYDNGDGTADFCGGVLVAKNKVLTAGHCVTGKNWAAHGYVIAGTSTLWDGSTAPSSTVRSQWLNPAYDDAAITNDMALLTLTTPLNNKTLPLATPNDTSLYAAGTNATVYGWGVTDSAPGSQNLAQSLQSVVLPVNSDTTCKDELDGAVGAGAYVAGKMMCAGAGGTGDDTTGKSTCSGDSGGPLVVGGKVIGLVSWAPAILNVQNCNVAGTYDVFTKVSSYNGTVQPRINDTDVSGDGKADVLAKTPAGASYAIASTGTGVKTRVTAPISFKNYNLVVQADLERDGYQDYLLRSSSTGNVFMAHRTPTRSSYSYSQIGTNWKSVKAMLVPGDVTGDGVPDLLTEDSLGRVWVRAGIGNGLFSGGVLTNVSWSRFNQVVGHGDYSGDGIADVLGRDPKTGGLYLLRGTGKASAPFGTPTVIRTGWNGYDKLIAVGDFNADGHADLLARVPSGAAYLIKGTGQAGSAALSTAVRIAAGWNAYSLLG